MRLKLTLVICILSIVKTFAQLSPQTIEFNLGDTKVHLLIYEKPSDRVGMTFVHVHENETASLEAGLRYLSEHGGKLITLKHSNNGTVNRMVKFHIGKEKYQFDPNRIFTDDPIVLNNTLKSSSKNQVANQQAIAAMKALSHAIWAQVKESKLIVALHNNFNKPSKIARKGWFKKVIEEESYNITSYVMKNDTPNSSAKSCDDIYINPRLNNSEFFIVTNKVEFDYFLSQRLSVVLQNQSPVDDGSMSVYASKNKIRYINSEAKHGRVSEQYKMLHFVENIEF